MVGTPASVVPNCCSIWRSTRRACASSVSPAGVTFTPWLLRNVDVLNDLLGMDLVLDRAEAAAGEDGQARDLLELKRQAPFL